MSMTDVELIVLEDIELADTCDVLDCDNEAKWKFICAVCHIETHVCTECRDRVLADQRNVHEVPFLMQLMGLGVHYVCAGCETPLPDPISFEPL
jgi:hypothetical protein